MIEIASISPGKSPKKIIRQTTVDIFLLSKNESDIKPLNSNVIIDTKIAVLNELINESMNF